MVVPHKALKPRWKSANVSTGWLAQVAVRARPKRNGVMMRCRRQNFTSVPQALSRGSENTHWNLSATMLSCPWSIWDSFRCLYSNTPTRSFGWIAIKIHNKIKYLKVPTYDECKDCDTRFDDLTDTIFAGHHQPLKVWVLCLYFMGLNLSNEQIARELDVDSSDVHQMTTALRERIVKKKH